MGSYLIIETVSVQDAMEWMGIIAIMVNCALIGLSGQMQRIFPDLPPHGTFILIVVLEVSVD